MLRAAARALTRRRSPCRNRRLTRSGAAVSSAESAVAAAAGFSSSTASMSSSSNADSLMRRLAASDANFAFFVGTMRAEIRGRRAAVTTSKASSCLTLTDACLSCPQAQTSPRPSARRRVSKRSPLRPPLALKLEARKNLRHAEGWSNEAPRERRKKTRSQAGQGRQESPAVRSSTIETEARCSGVAYSLQGARRETLVLGVLEMEFGSLP